ncbi:hypothetical protein [Pluralibacter gergoviae]|uniref:hypothetical protein n=1 Tax=Pluralibacter gergoviae TaxID=61647 RepID=UPI0009080063|nr:hypothetical protein [Pluralibacter gergoviae]
MPNVKIYIDSQCVDPTQQSISEVLPSLRRILCDSLDVSESACHIVVINVLGLVGQPPLNLELAILPKPERTRRVLEELAGELRTVLSQALHCQAAIRISHLDPSTYIALK